MLLQESSMTKLWLQALRLQHWLKNFFVFAPFLVGPKFGLNEYLLKSLSGVFLFGLMSSAVYVFNDIVDINSDREHPEKRFRPIASGKISVPTAICMSVVLSSIPLILAFFLNVNFFLALVAYAANNLLYSFYFKNKTVLDIMSIAFGFVIRTYAGGFVIGIDITNWMIVCIFCLSLFLGFGKRRSEIEALGHEARNVRKVHESYTIQKLNLLLGVSASITIVVYMLYSMAPETRAIHGTDNLVFTTPFVIYCIYRYLLKVQEKKRGEGPVEIILRDKGFLLAGCLWIISFVFLVHS